MAAEYFRSPENPYASSVDFYARGPERRSIWGRDYPTVDIELFKGGYEYGQNDDTETLRHNRFAKPGEQLKMFEAHPSKIVSAFADRDMRAHTPTVIGMAINEAKKIGMGLTYSHDLSEHSSKLAKQGLELGVVAPNKSNPEALQTNDIGHTGLSDYEHSYTGGHFIDFDPVSKEEIQAGRETIRGLVKQHIQAKKAHMGEQFENLNPEGWHQPELGQ